jgi:hypothetical protein
MVIACTLPLRRGYTPTGYDFFEVCTLTFVYTRVTLVLLQSGQAGGGLFSYSVIVKCTENSFRQLLHR